MADNLNILLAEDDAGHATLIMRNLKRAGVANEVVHVTDGQQALDYIRCEGNYKDRVHEGKLLVLLDINMPKVDGTEVLRQLKSDPRTSMVPVIMLTTTEDNREIDRCYSLGCSVYVMKPVAYEDFVEALRRLGLFLSIIKTPQQVTHEQHA